MKTHHRAVDLFTTAANNTVNDCRAIMAEHSAKGALGSGATAKRAADAFRHRTEEALDQMLGEVAHQVEHRGTKWRKEMAEVERALNEHLASAPEVLERTFKAAKADSGAANAAIMSVLEWDADAIRKRFAAFRDGWTAPRAKRWQERNAIKYGLILLALGAVAGKLAGPLVDAGLKKTGVDRILGLEPHGENQTRP